MLNQRRVIQWLSSAVVVALAIQATPAAASLVANGGFEAGTGADADFWTELEIATPPALASTDRVNTMPASGNWSIELAVIGSSMSVGTNSEIQQLTPANSIVPGNTYDLTFLGKAGLIGPGVVVFAEVQWLDSDGSHGGGVKGGTGLLGLHGSLTGAYQPFGFSNIVAAPDSDAALVIVRMNGGAFDGSDGVAYFDDFTLTPEPATVALLALGGLALIRRRR